MGRCRFRGNKECANVVTKMSRYFVFVRTRVQLLFGRKTNDRGAARR